MITSRHPTVVQDLAELTIVRCSAAQARVTIDRVMPDSAQDAASLYQRIDKAPSDLATWALVPRAEPTTLDLLSHCDTYRRKAKVCSPGDAHTHDEVAYGVSAVWTPPEYRNRGYARRMLRLLHYALAPPELMPPFPNGWGQPPSAEGFGDATISFLMSGIDGAFYAKCSQGEGECAPLGWIPVPPKTRLWTVPSTSSEVALPFGWRWLDVLAVHRLKPTYDDILNNVRPSEKLRFAVVPDVSAITAHAVPSTLAQGVFGLQVGPDAWFTFFRLRPAPDMAMRIVLSAVRGHVPFAAVKLAAHRLGAEVVEFGAEYDEWDDHMVEIDTEWPKPCFAVYGRDPGEVQWIAHEALIIEGVGTPGRWAWY